MTARRSGFLGLVVAAVAVACGGARPAGKVTSEGQPSSVPPVTTSGACRNSYDPACGPFSWDPPPHNRPLTIQASAQPAEGAADRRFAFHVVADDPDAEIVSCLPRVDWGDNVVENEDCVVNYNCRVETRFGPWRPPPPGAPGHADFDLSHTYARPGAYRVTFQMGSGSGCDLSYASQATKTLTVVVP